MASILIVGATGLLGRHLVPLFETSAAVDTPTHSQFDLLWEPARLIEKLPTEYNIVVNCAGYTNVQEANRHPQCDMAMRINKDGVKWLTLLPSATQIYHISTDYVYDNMTPNSLESDLLNPKGGYALSKAAGDTLLLSECLPNLHIIRTSFKPTQWRWPVAFDDVRTNADTVDIIALMIADFIKLHPPGGVYNLGTESKTMYELAIRNNPDIQKASWKKKWMDWERMDKTDWMDDQVLKNPLTHMGSFFTMDLTKYKNLL